MYRGNNRPHKLFKTSPRPIGSGQFGIVYSVKASSDERRNFALKILKEDNDVGLREAEIHRVLQRHNQHCPNIIRYYKSFINKDRICLCMELMQYTVREATEDYPKQQLPMTCIQKILRQVINGIGYLGNWDITHTDINPENLVCNSSNFDLVKIIDLSSAFRGTQHRDNTLTTIAYRCPDVMWNDILSPKIDIWSLGMTLFELCIGKPFLRGESAYEQMSLYCDYFGLPPLSIVSSENIDAKDFNNFFEVADGQIRLCTDEEYHQRTKIHPVLGGETKPFTRLDTLFEEQYVNIDSQNHHEEQLEKADFKNFNILLTRMLLWNVDERASVEDVMNSPFLVNSQLERYRNRGARQPIVVSVENHSLHMRAMDMVPEDVEIDEYAL